MIEYAIDCFVWFINSGIIESVLSVSVTVGIVKLVYHLVRRVQ